MSDKPIHTRNFTECKGAVANHTGTFPPWKENEFRFQLVKGVYNLALFLNKPVEPSSDVHNHSQLHFPAGSSISIDPNSSFDSHLAYFLLGFSICKDRIVLAADTNSLVDIEKDVIRRLSVSRTHPRRRGCLKPRLLASSEG